MLDDASRGKNLAEKQLILLGTASLRSLLFIFLFPSLVLTFQREF